MPKLKPIKFSDYSKDTFNHDLELEQLIISLHNKNKVTLSSGRYKVDHASFTVYFECNRIADVINHGTPLQLINASLYTWIGSWHSQTKVSHTMIDKTTLFTLLKLLS